MSPADLAQLVALRSEIEAVDAALIDTIARRMMLAKEIRRVKQRAGQPVLDPAREAAVVARASARARDAGLPEDEVRALYWKLMAVARRVQVEG
jgi:chorismate mutase